jgi:GNAT superfamily N-acetyltransferase
MHVRAGEPEDIPAIVNLLKLSLGESLMPKSEAFWRWKHIDNPFGESPVLLAFEEQQLVGIRAFMRWQWRHGDKLYNAVRAVDTATHPQHQGKGIFKKLTLTLAEECRNEKVDFIFNTPNTSSKPGYLKMGWKSNGKMHVYLKPILRARMKALDFEARYSMADGRKQFIKKDIFLEDTFMQTELSDQFLYWRYTNNPNINYYAFSDRDESPTYYTIFRLKPYRFGLEFRICESLKTTQANHVNYQHHLMQIARASGANLITSAKNIQLFPFLALPIGPEITTRPLHFNSNVLTFNSWKPSLGDMEVF